MVQKMPIPTRSAPRPPGNYGTQNNQTWSNNDPFGAPSMMQPVQKKKPPPRPPPPRFRRDSNAPRQEERGKKAARPTELLTNLFGRRTHQRQENINVSLSGNRLSGPSSTSANPPDALSVSLIDLSPPGSPTFTTRSSSDGVSVDSFGSDGNSNPSVFTSSGNTSQTESAFEDDFDFFGSLSGGKTSSSDPWKVNNSQDPFSPLPSNGNSGNATKRFGDARFFAYNESSASSTTTTTTTSSRIGFEAAPVANVAMPTIIRARPPKPPMPKSLNRSLAPTVTDFQARANTSAFSKIKNVPSSEPINASFNVNSAWSANFDDNPSPPMPSIPPPAPPAEFFTEIDDNAKATRENHDAPRGIALYDFAASQPGDLPLKQGDNVALLRAVNDDWLEGRIGNRSGIFPANFVDVLVPLPGSSANVVNALYTFTGETWEDLPFEEGAKITVLSRISDEWLYGEYRGKKGQFPANYVDRIPHDLPQHS